MRMVARWVLSLALAVALIALMPDPAAACLCGTPEEGRANAQVAFVGVVAAVDDPSFPGWAASTGDPLLYTFAVEDVIKGSPDAFVVVRSTRLEGSGSCAIDLAVGERWEIHAGRFEGDLWTSICSGNTLLASSVVPPAVPGRGPEPVRVVLVLGAAALVLGTWHFLGRRARSEAKS
jgi:hypothetical protein